MKFKLETNYESINLKSIFFFNYINYVEFREI